MVNPVMPGRFPSQFPGKFTELFVNSASGSDEANGTQANPYRTITRALQQILSGRTASGVTASDMTTIRLSPGTYSAESGEIFPLIIPHKVSIAGEATGQGQTVVIMGGGEYHSPTFGTQSIAIWLGDTTLLNGVTVTNAMPKGTGLWIEFSTTVANCSILNCGREGILATDRANLAIVDCLLQGNRASGISLVRHAKGQIRRSLHQGNSFGLVISDYAAPLIIDSQFVENRSGIIVSGGACPVLRNNSIERNHRDGLALFNQASPDLGQPQDPGHNCLQANGECDLRNTTAIEIELAGNDLMPMRVQGAVKFAVSQVTSQVAKPADTVNSTNTRLRKVSNASIQTPNPRLKPVLPPTPHFPTPKPHTTIPDLIGHWAEPFVHGLLAHWTINTFLGSTFQPDRPISRAEYATWLIKTFNLPNKQSPQPCLDVSAEYWANTAIVQAQRMGFLTVFVDQTFRPEVNLTRLQAIGSLVNGLGLLDEHPEALHCYRDRVQVPSWAVAAVASATQNRFVVSQTEVDRLRPLENVTRAELAAMLYQGLVWLGQAPPIASAQIVNPVAVASFSDIQQHWAADWIRGVVSQGLMAGAPNGTFAPDRSFTRAEYAVLLVNLFRPMPERPGKNFVDVPDSADIAVDIAADTEPAFIDIKTINIKATDTTAINTTAIDRVYRGKLMAGFADGTFRPQQPITRLQVLLALVSGLKCPATKLSLLDRFTDASVIPELIRPAAAAATAEWLVVNYPNLTQLRPHQPATRAEVAAMVYQALVHLGRANAIPSPYLIDPRYPNQHQEFRSAPIVVLDPGHGGADRGAITEGKSPEVPGLLPVTPMPALQEKNIVLPIAQQIATLLQQHGVQVMLTRSSDRYVDLPTRLYLANQVAADLLISLHANATTPKQPEINGLETYYYAADPVSKALAHILHTTILQSLQLQSCNLDDRQIHPSHFYLLRSAAMPAAHLEIGYITGNQDGPNLANPNYGKQMAEAIANGVLRYIARAAQI